MNVRLAEITDASEIARLTAQLGYPTDETALLRRLRKIADDRDHGVFVIEDGPSRLAGWVHVHGRHLLEADSFAEIGGLVVDAECRRRGAGRRLMRRAEQWAAEHGYEQVRLRSGEQREDAHAFYEKIGYRHVKRQEVFALTL